MIRAVILFKKKILANIAILWGRKGRRMVYQHEKHCLIQIAAKNNNYLEAIRNSKYVLKSYGLFVYCQKTKRPGNSK